jgi:hypothetical protein
MAVTPHRESTTRSCAKIPHAWLVDARSKKVSTLDVFGRGQFSLVTGLAGRAWAEAVAAFDRPWLRAVVIGEPAHQDDSSHAFSKGECTLVHTMADAMEWSHGRDRTGLAATGSALRHRDA